MIRRAVLTTAFTCLALLVTTNAGNAQEIEVTANAGWLSDYFFRGIPQKTSSASAGLDVAVNGLNMGVWGANVGEGNEVDLYGGYATQIQNLSLSLGGTAYLYTGGYDNRYLEANLGVGMGPLAIEFSLGQYGVTPIPQEYWFLGLTVEHNGGYATVGSFGNDFDGEYVEAGYGFAAAELDLMISWIYSTATLVGERDHTLVLGVGKTFQLN